MSTSKFFDFQRTPSLQHAVYLIGPSVDATAENIRRLKKATPPYRLDRTRRMVEDVLKAFPTFGMGAVEQARANLPTLFKDPALLKASTEILECLEEYLQTVQVKWFRPVPTFPYPIGRGLAIPVNPLGMISDGEKIRLMWPQMWRSRTLNTEQFNLYGAVIDRSVFEVVTEITELEWMEMSAPAGSKKRELRLRGRDAYAPMSDEELVAGLDRLAHAVEIVNSEAPPAGATRRGPKRDPKQGSFFDDDDDGKK